MNCLQAQDWLLDAEAPGDRRGWPTALADHVHECKTCARLIDRLQRLERGWRQLPVPRAVETARDAFLANLPGRRPSRRSFRLRPALVAGLLLTALAASLWILVPSPDVAAEQPDDVIDRLVAWTVELADTDEAADRERLYHGQAPLLAARLQEAALPEGDRQLADVLLASAAELTARDDPLDRAEQLDAVAGSLLERGEDAARAGNAQARLDYARRSEKVRVNGVEANLRKVAKVKKLGPKQKRKLERLRAKRSIRDQALHRLLRLPAGASAQEVRRAVEKPPRKAKAVRRSKSER